MFYFNGEKCYIDKQHFDFSNYFNMLNVVPHNQFSPGT